MTRNLNVVQDELRRCTKCCVEAGYIPEARPLVLGNIDAHLTWLSGKPRRASPMNRTVCFIVAPRGRNCADGLSQAGFRRDAEFGTRIYLAAITRCFPRSHCPDRAKTACPRAPNKPLCRPWLDEELDAC